jgi:hypothetical protein
VLSTAFVQSVDEQTFAGADRSLNTLPGGWGKLCFFASGEWNREDRAARLKWENATKNHSRWNIWWTFGCGVRVMVYLY